MTEEIKERFINPFTDFGFKRLFGTEPNKDLLIDFLNQLLPAKNKIVDLRYTNSEGLPEIKDDRKAVFDIYCTNTRGEKFIVEMQKAGQKYFIDRSIFYSSFPIQEQAKIKVQECANENRSWDYQLDPIYLVGVLNFTFSKSLKPIEKEVFHTVMLKDQNNKVFFTKYTLLYLEMPHFTKTLSELKTNFDKWLWILKYLPTLKEIPAELADGIFKKLFDVAEIAGFSKEEKLQYDASVKIHRDLTNTIEFAQEKQRLAEEDRDRVVNLLEVTQTALESSEKQAEADRLAKADAEKAKANAEKQAEADRLAKADAEAQNAILLAKMKAMEEEIKRIQKK